MDRQTGFSTSEAEEDSSVDKDARVIEVAKYKEAVKAIPDIRQKRIEELKRQIESGEYHVDSKKIAEKILNRRLEDGSF